MSEVEWFDRLMLALRARDVTGRQVGETLTELQTYVADSGTDPWEEFGDPSDFADSLAGRSGQTRQTKVRFGIYVVVTNIGWLAVIGLFAVGDVGSVSVPLFMFLAGVIFTGGMTAFFLRLFVTTGPVLEGKQPPYPKLKVTLYWVIIVLACVAVVSLPERPILRIPGALLWLIAIAAWSYIVVETILIARHGRLKVPDQASPHGEDLVRRWTGIQGIKTGWRIGRRVHDGSLVVVGRLLGAALLTFGVVAVTVLNYTVLGVVSGVIGIGLVIGTFELR